MSQTISTQSASPTIPVDLGATKRSGINAKFIVGGLLLLAFVGFLGFNMIQATTSTGAYYMTVAELNEEGTSLIGQRIRVNGLVTDGSEDWNAQEITLKFAIDDENGANVESLPIVFYGPRPDNFQRASSAIVEGTLLEDGSFQADTLLLKCPSRYEEEPEEIYVESTRG
ncbi:MAG: cytochrome c maturation protein CcmE [Chloroflexota bacterium]